jgi:hypothetical protein
MMKTEYQYIRFEKVAEKPKTSIWVCVHSKKRQRIGKVSWYGPWRQYCFFPGDMIVFNVSCLQDICHFIQQLPRKTRTNKGD